MIIGRTKNNQWPFLLLKVSNFSCYMLDVAERQNPHITSLKTREKWPFYVSCFMLDVAERQNLHITRLKTRKKIFTDHLNMRISVNFFHKWTGYFTHLYFSCTSFLQQTLVTNLSLVSHFDVILNNYVFHLVLDVYFKSVLKWF